MKNTIAIALISYFFIMACASTKKVAYTFPAAMAPAVQEAYTKQCDKGKVLYDLSCSGCHTRKAGRQELIPDFTADQLEAYKIRVANPRHEMNISENSVSPEELGLIMTFLTYKEKNKQ